VLPNIKSIGEIHMSDVQDYASSLSDTSSRKFETFSYLPDLTAAQTREQIVYILDKGWNPVIEHTEPKNQTSTYWYMWKLPLFGETDVDVVLKEIEACKAAHPANHVRLLGLDNFVQCAGTSMIVHRGITV
jgi:ribulose-bisphosphate carboxylase small chain